jgi:hypothetical protein
VSGCRQAVGRLADRRKNAGPAAFPALVARFARADATENAKKRGFLHWFTQNRHKKQAFFAFAHGQMPRESIM